MTIKNILSGGAALCALRMAPAVASPAPHIIAVAAHPGEVHVKTSLHAEKPTTSCSTISISTGVSTSSAYKVKTPLSGTYYTFFDSGSFCNSSEHQRVKLAVRKTSYAKLSPGTETYTGYCSTAPTVFYGDVYDLRTKKAQGKKDTFTSTLVGKHIHYNGGLYDLSIVINVVVKIGT